MSKQSNYTLVCFINEMLENNIKSVDVVPSSWLRCNNNGVFCPFINNFSKSQVHKVHELVKNLHTPCESWNLYPVEIKGYAGKLCKHLLLLINKL